MTDHELRKCAEALIPFFTAIRRPGELVHIYARLPDEKVKYFAEHMDELPFKLGGRCLRGWDPERQISPPAEVLRAFSRKPESTRIDTLRQLWELNEFGYDIFVSANPMICARRCQKAAKRAALIVLEGDRASLETQRGAFDLLKEVAVSIVYSGKRSFHALVAPSPNLRNPHCLGQREVLALKEGDTSAPWPEYREVADMWIKTLKSWGLEVDAPVARDYARLTRVPLFKHSETGMPATLEWINPKASWPWKQARRTIEAWDRMIEEDSFHESRNPARAPRRDDGVASGSWPLEPSLASPPSGVSSSATLPSSTDSSSAVAPVAPILPTSASSSESPLPSSLTPPGKITLCASGTFLGDLAVVEALKVTGIPARHTRRMHHRAFFTTARVMGWTENRMCQEWRSIVSMHPSHIGCSAEEAIEDMIRAWRASQPYRIYLPDTTSLPIVRRKDKRRLEEILKERGCLSPRNAASVTVKVLIPLIRRIPQACMAGTAGVSSRKLWDACSGNRKDRNCRSALDWLVEHMVLTPTCKSYVPGKRTRRFFVNIPLVVLLMGWKEEELDWSRGTSMSTRQETRTAA